MRNINGLKDKLNSLEDYNVDIRVSHHQCCSCGKITDVELCIEPYNADINDEYNWIFLCEDCYHQNCMDI